MRSDGILKHLAIALVVALIFYVVGFGWLQHRRTFKGPWEVTFRTDAGGAPALIVAQSTLDITQTITFPGQKIIPGNLSRTVRFVEATSDLPFGEMIFQDPTFLPGTVTMRQFGHEIELLPRVLTIDKKEYPWHSGSEIQVR